MAGTATGSTVAAGSTGAMVDGISRGVDRATTAGKGASAAIELVLRLRLFRSISAGDKATGVPIVGVVEADDAFTATGVVAKGVV